MREVWLVKLGGSLLTDKRRPATARPERIERLAAELAGALAGGDPPLVVLGHGSGSFGHVEAERAGLQRGPVDETARGGLVATQRAARELHGRVVQALAGAGAFPYSFAPGSALIADAGRPVELNAEPVARALGLGLVPVVFGDLVVDRSWGASIASTETVLVAFAERLPAFGLTPVRALWLGDTPGLLDGGGEPVAAVDPEAAEGLLATAGGAAGTDVTGGMRHRLEMALALAALGVESLLADGTVPGLLARALAGERVPGTRVPARTR